MSATPEKSKDTSLTLMVRVQQDPADAGAWDEFVARYQPMIRAWCERWGAQPSDADDVTQQVLLNLLSAIKKYRKLTGTGFRGWLKTVTHHAWLDFVASRRRHARQHPGEVELVADSSDALADLEREMEDAFEREFLDLAMRRVEGRVKPTTWEAFRLTAMEHLSGAEAAVRLEMQPSAVFVAKHRVMKLLEEEVHALKAMRD